MLGRLDKTREMGQSGAIDPECTSVHRMTTQMGRVGFLVVVQGRGEGS